MWDEQWEALCSRYDVARLDLRGYGESQRRPIGALDPVADVIEVLTALDLERCHLVGASYRAGVALEVALTHPSRVASLFLSAPGGSLLPAMTPTLRAFFDAERAALAAGDLDAAVEANLATWVDGPSRDRGAVAPRVRECVAAMQRRAFEITADWDDVEEVELEPAALSRLDEVGCPTTVLVGGLDLDVIHDAAALVVGGVAGARRVDWPDVAHLPSMEHADDFVVVLNEHVSLVGRA